jgi:nanoRNase/pAp phosphatase (c-di-AMP/oligoRNAs hydrolase)
MISTAPLEPRLVRLLEDGTSFAVLTHVNADGDGLGSSLALWAFLRARGKQARMINTDPVPANRFLKLAGRPDPRRTAPSWSGDAVFVLDNGSLAARISRADVRTPAIKGLSTITRRNLDLAVIDSGPAFGGDVARILERGRRS